MPSFCTPPHLQHRRGAILAYPVALIPPAAPAGHVPAQTVRVRFNIQRTAIMSDGGLGFMAAEQCVRALIVLRSSPLLLPLLCS